MLRATPLFLLLSTATFAQYSGPESVEYDPVGDRYFVSNVQSGQIVERSQAGATSTFATVSHAPYGLEIMGEVLYACSGGGVKGYALADAALVFNLSLGGGFSNGITTDGTFLYVTDFSGKRILKVDPATTSYEVLVANTGNTPNGIVFDPVRDRLWVAGWGSSALIKAYDRVEGTQLSSFTTSVGSIDGITLDCNGKLLAASWSPARITRFDPEQMANAVTVLNSGLSSPADIDYDAVNDRVCIPNSGNSTVLLHPYGCSTGVVEAEAWPLGIAPNPATDRVQVTGRAVAGAHCVVRDLQGRTVLALRLRADGLVDVAALPAGTYVVELAGHAPARLIKQ